MRAGGSTVQQALTAEAAGVVKQAVSLARRRGHAQVTPLHVASVMLSSSSGIFRVACLQSHSHPLQCKALELCFNVALNRLPASTASSPMLSPHQPYSHHHHHHHHHHPPTLSNALVAAFKRAQAQQRRGSIESQQQPLLAVKIELEQLIISILDDPSVSRVMREAGFSSTQVKNNVEQAVSEISESSPLSTSTMAKLKPNPPSVKPAPADQAREEDVQAVVDLLARRKKKSVVVVGENSAAAEGVVKTVIDRIGKGDVPRIVENVQLISLPLMSFRSLSKEDVEQKLAELSCLLKSFSAENGAVLYLGDLKWVAEYEAASGGKVRNCYCPVEHAIIKLGWLVSGWSEEETSGGRFWLMGIATYQTFIRCKAGNPSLEAVLGLFPITIPSGSLRLSLSCDSGHTGNVTSWPLSGSGGESRLSSRNPPREVEIQTKGLTHEFGRNVRSVTTGLPSWLQLHKEENRRAPTVGEAIGDLCKSSPPDHHRLLREKALKFSISPTSSSVFSDGQDHCSVPQTQKTCHIASHGRSTWIDNDESPSQNVDVYPKPNPRPFLTSSSETMEEDHHNGFKELSAENLKTLCLALEKKVMWQKDIVPDIAATVVRCRSGMARKKDRSNSMVREDTWMLFQGGDHRGKEKVARGLASLIFGSSKSFVSFGLSSFPSARSGSSDDVRCKRPRSEDHSSPAERLAEAIRKSPHTVVLMEDVEQMDYSTQMDIKKAIERGKIRSSDGEEIGLGDAIVILSCESFDSRSRACSPTDKQKAECDEDSALEGEKEKLRFKPWDLNMSPRDQDEVEARTFDGMDLLALVDGRFFFKLENF